MYITMQGNWTVKIKSQEASPKSQFIISGAASGNGTYHGANGLSVSVISSQPWTISIQNKQGANYAGSFTRIKFPVIIGGDYTFDIESNDDQNDTVFDDLILTCSTPAMIDDYLIYGHVKTYTPPCYFNPCYPPPWLVIDTPAALVEALRNPALNAVITQLYPERVTPPAIFNPNPPDPPPFIPMMINMSSYQQIPAKTGFLYRKKNMDVETAKKMAKTAQNPAGGSIRRDALTFDKKLALNSLSNDAASKYTYSLGSLAAILIN